MTIESFIQFVNQVGFPVMACVAMFWEMNKTRESHAEEMEVVVSALNQNTQTIQKLDSAIMALMATVKV